MEQKDQINILKIQIKNEKELLKRHVERKGKAKKALMECTDGDYSTKLSEYETTLQHISIQYAKLSAIIKIGCMLDLISSVEFAGLVDEISELAFS